MITKLYQCDCTCSGLTISREDDEEGEITEEVGDKLKTTHIQTSPTVYVSLWKYGDIDYSWRRKIQVVWYIIKNGHPYTDTIILSKETALQLSKDIKEMVK